MSKNKKIIFLDRDGVINKDPGGWTKYNYVTEVDEFIFLPNSIRALKKLNSAGYRIILISNQAGVGKGHYTKNELIKINQNMLQIIERERAKIEKTYYCVHKDSDNCECRKPKTGLFDKAEKELGVRAYGNYFIGDGKTDIEAGQKKGMKTILLLSGKTKKEDINNWEIKPDHIFNDLLEAVDFILKSPSQLQ